MQAREDAAFLGHILTGLRPHDQMCVDTAARDSGGPPTSDQDTSVEEEGHWVGKAKAPASRGGRPLSIRRRRGGGLHRALRASGLDNPGPRLQRSQGAHELSGNSPQQPRHPPGPQAPGNSPGSRLGDAPGKDLPRPPQAGKREGKRKRPHGRPRGGAEDPGLAQSQSPQARLGQHGRSRVTGRHQCGPRPPTLVNVFHPQKCTQQTAQTADSCSQLVRRVGADRLRPDSADTRLSPRKTRSSTAYIQSLSHTPRRVDSETHQRQNRSTETETSLPTETQEEGGRWLNIYRVRTWKWIHLDKLYPERVTGRHPDGWTAGPQQRVARRYQHSPRRGEGSEAVSFLCRKDGKVCTGGAADD